MRCSKLVILNPLCGFFFTVEPYIPRVTDTGEVRFPLLAFPSVLTGVRVTPYVLTAVTMIPVVAMTGFASLQTIIHTYEKMNVYLLKIVLGCKKLSVVEVSVLEKCPY